MNECFIFTRPEFCFYSWWQYFETWKESQAQVAGSLSLKTALLYILTRPVTLGSEMKLPFTAKIFRHLLLKTALLEETQPNHLPTKKSVWHGLICLFVWISSTSVGYFVLWSAIQIIAIIIIKLAFTYLLMCTFGIINCLWQLCTQAYWNWF